MSSLSYMDGFGPVSIDAQKNKFSLGENTLDKNEVPEALGRAAVRVIGDALAGLHATGRRHPFACRQGFLPTRDDHGALA